mgnify:CR=1 FL=1
MRGLERDLLRKRICLGDVGALDKDSRDIPACIEDRLVDQGTTVREQRLAVRCP